MRKPLIVALGAVALMVTAPSPHTTTAAAARPYLDAANETARWIRSTAVKTPHGTAWPVTPASPDARTQAVNPTLYSGTPGVVLFFLELHRATGRAEDLNDARAGADHLLATLDDKPQSGLYTGIAGVGFVLGEVYKATGDEKYRAGMQKSVEILQRTAITKGCGRRVDAGDRHHQRHGRHRALPAARRSRAEDAGGNRTGGPRRTTPHGARGEGSRRHQMADEP